MLFEVSFQSDWKHYVRLFDEQKDASVVRELPNKYESYVRDPLGPFTSFYKGVEVRYRKVHSDFKESRKNVSPISPSDIIIRDYFSTPGSYNSKPRIFYMDIETRTGTKSTGFPNAKQSLEPVCLIQILDSKTNKIYIIGDKEFYFSKWYLEKPDVKDYEVQYIECKDEISIFENFFSLLHNLKPLICYAWNGDNFDFPYLANRAKRLSLDLNKFSPFYDTLNGNLTNLREQEFEGQYFADFIVAGVLYIDQMKVYKKFVLAPRESYTLNNISSVELGAQKVDHFEFRTFDDFYQGNWVKPTNPTEQEKQTLCYILNEKGYSYDIIQKAGYGQFVYYGIKDVILIKDLDIKLGLTKLLISVAEKQTSQLMDVLGTTKPWGNAIRNRLYKYQHIINPLEIDVNLDKHIQGGYVRVPAKGKQEWVLSADVNSMYPMLAMVGFNMSPENFIHPRDLKDPELKSFIYRELKVDTADEQNEENMLNLLKHPDKINTLKMLLRRNNLSMAPNGMCFNKNIRGVVPTMVKNIYEERKSTKKEMIKAEQKVKAIQEELRKRNA